MQPHYLGVVADVFSTNVQVCQSPVNLGKFIFLVASVFYNGSFNLFLLCLQGFLLSGVFRLRLFFFFPVEVSPLMMTGLGICLCKADLTGCSSSTATKPIVIFSLLSSTSSIFPLCVYSIESLGKHTLGQCIHDKVAF